MPSDPDYHASSTDWELYYRHHQDRPARPFAIEAFDLAGPPGRAVDLGCGQGSETAELLRRGWSVLAIDSDPRAVQRVSALVLGADGRLTVREQDLAEITELPPADLVHAGFSLPFCRPSAFPALWSAIERSLAGGGLFVGQLFGDHDTWAATDDGLMNFHDEAGINALFDGWEVLRREVEDAEGNSLAGPKHWHVFHLIARNRRPGRDVPRS